MICIISGPTCSGKSAFLSNPKNFKWTGYPPSTPVVFPKKILKQEFDLGDDFFIHYNILRYANQLWHADQFHQNSKDKSDSCINFASELTWNKVISFPYSKMAIILVAKRSVLLDRISCREVVEQSRPNFNNPGHPYPQHKWINILKSIDLNILYQAWCSELEKNKIPFTLLDSNNKSYSIIEPSQIRHINLNS